MVESFHDKKIRLEKLQLEKKRKSELPHIYGYKWYKWAWKFYDSDNKICLLVAGNQLSKTSTQIRKAIRWATSVDEWRNWWPHLYELRGQDFKPLLWYLYPDRDTATEQFDDKWEGEFLPRGDMKDHPIYGWKRTNDKDKRIYSVEFNSGATIYFKTYSKKAANLQGGSVSAIFCDEELPMDKYDEVMNRISGTNGYFNMVFTATLAQEFWHDCMEKRGKKEEKLKSALKLTVSNYDCLTYMDGTKSHWTKKRIKERIASCQNQNEIDKRIFGRFVKDDDLKFFSFGSRRNVCEHRKIMHNWDIYAGVDVGSGGKAHPGAIVFAAISPNQNEILVFAGWKGNHVERTTAGDIYEKYRDMKSDYKKNFRMCSYDFAAADFATIAQRDGESVIPANKNHEAGERVLNTCFKLGIIKIFDTPELEPLIYELKSLDNTTPKTKAKDDYADALRYCIMGIPIDWSYCFRKIIKFKKETKELKKAPPRGRDAGREYVPERDEEAFEEEISEYNELYGVDGVYH
jgi:hypothetical protein